MSLGREPNAVLSIISSTGQEDDSFFLPQAWDTNLGPTRGTNTDDFAAMKSYLKMDSKTVKTITFRENTSGSVTVEYSNLSNSKYTDVNGNDISIAKIRLTYNIGSSNIKHGIIIFSDPTDGFGELGVGNITLSNFSFYDQSGNKINLSNNSAYLAVTSLNNHGNGLIETVTAGNNTKAYTLAGSSISNHDGSLYADQENDADRSGSSWKSVEHGGANWDNKGPNEYYGTGILSLSGTDFGMTFSYQNIDKDRGIQQSNGAYGPWFTFTTVIPETPTPKRKTTEIHYHYNTKNKILEEMRS